MSMIQPGILADAADYIDQHGWTQGQFETDDGKVCLLGAVRRCTPIPGDRHLVEQVMHRRRRADVWNDANDRTVDEVTAYLREHADVTDEELADTFGPQWREIVAQVRVISGATPQQLSDLAAAWSAARTAAWSVVWDAARAAARAAAGSAAGSAVWDAVRDAARTAAWDAARTAAEDAARTAAWDAVRDAAEDAVRDAAWALATRGLIGTAGYTQKHYDLLTGPWRKTFGPQCLDGGEQ